MSDKPETQTTGALAEEDATALRDGLLASIESSTDPAIVKLADEIRDKTAWIDRDGALYVGTWRLDPGRARFVKRPMQAREGPVFEAVVARTDDGWTVGPITVGRMRAPRF